METKKKKARNVQIKKSKPEHSDDLVQEIKESLEDYNKGKYVKGDVKDIMKAIRECKNETD